MKKEILDKLKKELMSDDGFLSRIRFQEGFDQEKFDSLLELLVQISRDLKGEDRVPKYFVEMIIDLVPALISSSFNYQGDERDKINYSVDLLSEVLLDCFSS